MCTFYLRTVSFFVQNIRRKLFGIPAVVTAATAAVSTAAAAAAAGVTAGT